MLVKKVKRPFNFMIKRFDSCAKLSRIKTCFQCVSLRWLVTLFAFGLLISSKLTFDERQTKKTF